VRHSFFRAPRPLVFAHRGGSALAPENTIDAFDNGLRLGADGLELDVHLSRDGVIVVHHDRTLDRTTTLS
jgi:glycerophosphoryl diester phosphodiesterase